MQLTFTIICCLAIVAAVANLGLELKRDLMMLQQNSYRRERYYRWLSTSGDSTSVWRLCGMAVLLASLVIFAVPVFGAAMILLFSIACGINLARQRYKKPLVFTNRAKRIYAVSAAVSVLILLVGLAIAWLYQAGSSMMLFAGAVILAGEYCGSHVIITIANWALIPVEKSINRGYYDDAKNILRSMPALKVVGITGSYGKTSTKHYLYTILSEQFETVMTPGSFNTTLGVVRTVRENLKPYTEVFIAEMGAKQRGDVKEICDLVEPQIGIITAVGQQHLESFGSIENIQATKFELADALPHDGGLAVINNDFEKIADRPVENVATVRYSTNEADSAADAVAGNLEISARGTKFDFNYKGNTYHLSTKLVGRCNVSNLMAAVVVALHLGMDEASIQRGISRIEQVEHRLSIKNGYGGTIIIDDAFNSNPVGAGMALEVLSMMKSGKRIIVTPGMIELGDSQRDENFKFGQKIAVSADVAIVVGEYNREAITEGIKAVESSQIELHETASFADAQRLLAGIIKPGDAILYENDLPDTFK